MQTTEAVGISKYLNYIFFHFSGTGRVADSENRAKLIFYSIYSFGVPLLMTIMVYVLHKYDPIGHISEIWNGTSSSPDWRPGFGEETCWFTTCSSGILFLYG